MAVFYNLIVGTSALSLSYFNIPRPKIYGADILSLIVYCQYNRHYDYVHDSKAHKDRVRSAVERLKAETGKNFQELFRFLEDNYWKLYKEDMEKVYKKLKKEGYFDYIDPTTGNFIRAKKKPKEYIIQYQKIRELISKGKYEVAVQKYYNTLGDRFYDELRGELIYLKRLANIPLTGRDLLCFRSESSRNEFINSNLSEYCSCIDAVLEQYKQTGLKSPLDIIIENAPTMEELVEQRKQDWHFGVYLWNGSFKRDNTPVTIDSFSAGTCPEGRLFNRYPDQIQHFQHLRGVRQGDGRPCEN